MIKKLLSLALAGIMVMGMSTSAFAVEPNTPKDVFKIQKINGISRTLDSNVDAITSEADFNYILDEVQITVKNNNAIIDTIIEGNPVEFDATMYQGKLGYNATNTLFGVSSSVSQGFNLTKFTIERNTDAFSLMTPNSNMAGNTVVSLAFYNPTSTLTYYFQFIANDLVLPVATTTEKDMSDYELANFSAQPYETIKADIDSLEAEISNEFESIAQEPLDTILEDVPAVAAIQPLADSEESKMFDQLLIESQDGPISLQQGSRALVPNIPDAVYKSQTYGWETVNNDYVQEGSNAKRANGYVIYHMPDLNSGNALNYVMRIEGIMNYNFSSQRFIHSFKITHNLWVQYNAYQNAVAIFDDREWNARLEAEAETYVETPTGYNGYFTFYQGSTISHGSIMSNIIRAIIAWVPNLSEALTSFDEITSGTKLETGTLHSTDQYAKDVRLTMNQLRNPNDHVTVEGVGSGVNNISYGYSLSVTAN